MAKTRVYRAIRAPVRRYASVGRNHVNSQGVRLLGRVQLGKGVQIAPNTVIYGPTKIGSGSFIGPNVVLGFPARAELIASIAHRRGIHDMADRPQLIIGQDCIVRPGTCVYSGASVGDAVSFGHNVMVRENVRVGGHTLVGTNVVIDGYCDIGEYVSIQTGGYIPTNSKIEDGVFLGPHVVLTNDKYLARKKTRLVGPTIRKGASIGANSLLMPSIEIGERAVIGAHSFVLSNVPPGCVYAGVPARKLRDVPSDWTISLLKT